MPKFPELRINDRFDEIKELTVADRQKCWFLGLFNRLHTSNSAT